MRRNGLVSAVFVVLIVSVVWAGDNPLGVDFDEIVFVKRKPYSSDHNYTVVNNGTSADRFMAENGIYVYDLRSEKARPVITAADLPGGKGVIGKFSLSFDAKKVIFDYRPDVSSGFRIWEIALDGTDLRQLTFAPKDEAAKLAKYGNANFHTDDMHPCYLPDGSIIFTSSRCEHGILCGGQPGLVSVILHRMDADGTNIRKLTSSPVSEFSPVVLPDGRIMYHRWEYIDKGARVGKTFWVMMPDGSGAEELFGLSDSYRATGAHMYAMPVPGNDSLIACVSAPHYPQGNSSGPILMIDLAQDARSQKPITNFTPAVRVGQEQNGWMFASDNYKVLHADGRGGPLYTHPYPINENKLLVSYKHNDADHYRDVPGGYAIYMIEADGKHTFVYKDEDDSLSCWHPTPVLPRQLPMKIDSASDSNLKAASEATCIVTNVYQGMDNVQRGTVKYLRINEAIPRYWASKRMWSPNYQSNAWVAALWPRVQWGIVPVEADGSAFFNVPADRNIFFQALDENYMEVHRERTYVNYKPGEIRSCTGCHDRSRKVQNPVSNKNLLALNRSPSVPKPQPGETDAKQVIHYPTDIQPIFDAKCVSCHSDTKTDGDLNLAGTVTDRYSVSYEQLLSKSLAGPAIAEFISHTGRDDANINGSYLPPKSLGSHTSDLVKLVRTSDTSDPHHGLLDETEMLKLIRWVDTNYQFYGTYYGRHHGAHKGHPDFRHKPTFDEAISPDAPSWHK